MAPAAKKAKLETSTEQLEFLGMNDDCITLVLEKLHRTDMCSISFACKRLQQLTYDVHMRKYPDKIITMEPILEVKSQRFKVGFSESDESYLKYMSKAVRNVEMMCTRHSIRDYFKLLKSECCPNLKSLKIYRSRVNLSLIPANTIKDQLKNVEELSIQTLPAKRSKPHRNWLTCCKKLRKLAITTQFCNGEWLLDVYPELESLSIHLLKIDLENELFAKYASQFIERQPKLKEIKCVGYNTTQLLLQNVNNIPRLIVECKHDHSENIELLAESFKNYREQHGRIDSLEFHLDHEISGLRWLSEVDNVQPINGLRTKLLGRIGQSMIESLNHLVRLELIAAASTFSPIDWTRLSKNLPHLETLKLSFVRAYEKLNILQITMPFVRNMPKLERLEVTADKSVIIENDHLLVLNSARLLLKNPVHLHVNFELLGNKCNIIVPTSSILTTNIKQMQDIDEEEDSSLDDNDDDEDDDDDDDDEDEYDDDNEGHFWIDSDLSADSDSDDDEIIRFIFS